MNVLLLSMPDSFEHMPSLAIRMPNGGLTSIAGNVDPHHRVAVANLILVQDHVRETVTRLVRERIHALEGRALDEGAAHSGRAPPRPVVRPDADTQDADAHVSR